MLRFFLKGKVFLTIRI